MGLFVKIFEWRAILYVENATMHAYRHRQHEWRDASGRGLAIPEKYVMRFFLEEIRLKNVILFNCYKKGNIKNMLFFKKKIR